MAKESGRTPIKRESPFSKATQRLLRVAKWTPQRQKPTAVYKSAYQEEGATFSSATERFLKRFGGLTIHYPTGAGQPDVLEFCADDAIRGVGRTALTQLERLVGVAHLCPIGHYQYGTCMLLQDERGRVFGVSDDTLTRVGESGEEAIENILSNKEVLILRQELPPCKGDVKREHGTAV